MNGSDFGKKTRFGRRPKVSAEKSRQNEDRQKSKQQVARHFLRGFLGDVQGRWLKVEHSEDVFPVTDLILLCRADAKTAFRLRGADTKKPRGPGLFGYRA